MSIDWDAADRQFHLRNEQISLVLRVFEDGTLGQLHLGAALPAGRSYRHLGPDPFPGFSNRVGSPIPLAYPTSGTGDFRIPALVAATTDGATSLALQYRDHRIAAGKPALDGLPSTYVEDAAEAETLEITLADELAGLEVDLRFTIFRDRPAIARSATIRNSGSGPAELRCAMSLSVDLPDADWLMIGLAGAWARERHIAERPLVPGRQSASSVRGASGHEHNPFLALRRATTDEAHGEAYGFSLVYSGNFLAEAEVEPYGTTRVRLGIEPSTFSWRLDPGAEFTTPEAIVAWSDGRPGGAVRRVPRPLPRAPGPRGLARPPPAGPDQQLGGDLLRLRRRQAGRDRHHGARSGGRAVRARRRLVRRARRRHDLARRLVRRPAQAPRRHRRRGPPDHRPGPRFRPVDRAGDGQPAQPPVRRAPGLGDRRSPAGRGRRAASSSSWTCPARRSSTTWRSVLSDVLASAPISYIKWDMNRNITEPWTPSLPPDRQGEFFHRYILGVYELYRRLTTRFPEILFESCAGGGGRFDPGCWPSRRRPGRATTPTPSSA